MMKIAFCHHQNHQKRFGSFQIGFAEHHVFNQVSVSWLVGLGLGSIPPINNRNLATCIQQMETTGYSECARPEENQIGAG